MEMNFPIPALRQDLKIYKGGFEKDGSPTWMIYDPVSDNYFKIGWFEFECLSRIEKYKDMGRLAQEISKETTLEPDRDDVFEFVTFLITNNLCQANDPIVQNFQLYRDEDKGSFSLSKIFVKYIYFQIPLFRPDGFLKTLYPLISPFLGRSFLIFMMTVLFFGVFITIQRFDEFMASFTNFTNIDSFIAIIVATIFVKIIHELGHAFVAHKYKVPVTTIGIAFIVCYPILYTETTNSWRLYERKKRLQITMAGVVSELYLAAFALVLWHMLPVGMAQNIAFFVAIVSLFMSIMINGNPLMKFDGYYLASDLSQIDNLQHRAVDFLKWQIKKILFAYKEDPPEYFDIRTERFLIYFGLALVIYRFFLYLGIALMLYYFVMKPLGLLLMVLELYIFIAFPILKELKSWYTERAMLFSNKRPKIIVVAIVFVAILAFFPVNRTVKIPAVIHAQEYTSVYPVAVSEIEDITTFNGQKVQKNDVLFVLRSPVLDKEIAATQIEIDLYQAMQNREELLTKEQAYDVIFNERVLEAKTKLAGLYNQKEELIVRAQHSGIVQDIKSDIKNGRWIEPQTLLARVVNHSELNVSGYVSQRDVARIKEGLQGYFRPDSRLFGKVPVTLSGSLEFNTRMIQHPELSSLYGGHIPSDVDDNNQVIAKETLFLTQFFVLGGHQYDFSYSQKGALFLEAQPQVPISIFSQKVLSLFLREVGF